MRSRTNKLNHPSGIEIETPILVPSFSSKGFSFDSRGVSEATDALNLSKEFLTECLLLSAYDLYHKHIPFSEEYLCTDFTIIDSGGYETSNIYDFSAIAKYSYPIKDWSLEKYESIIDQWPTHKAGIIVSFDHGSNRSSLEQQIKNANDLFLKYPTFLNNFLIKPETENQKYIQVPNIIAQISALKSFTIIGMTEKELGNSILERMKNISKIRTALDDDSNNAPIHIFGSLDPITSLLYFLSGAEIFDGLTWLKYSYFNGSAIYQSNFGALHNELGIHIRDSQIRSKSIVNNIYCLEKMKYQMKDFISSSNFDLFNELNDELGDFLKKNFNTFESNLR